MKNYYVYMHTCPNNKKYIGITQQEPKKRWKSGYGYKKNKHFFSAIVKYGWNNIKHDILFQNLNKEQAEKIEIKLISYYKTNDRLFGYNIANGGNHNGKQSEETKLKISLANKGVRNGMYGKTSPNRGNKYSNEFRQKLSEAHKGQIPWNKGIPSKKETIFKWKESNKKRMKKVKCIETGIIYNSICDAERQTGLYRSNIICCCKGKTNTCGKMHWQYVD